MAPISKYYSYYIWIPVLFAILLLAACIKPLVNLGPPEAGPAARKAIRGELDLRGWDFSRDGSPRLDGEWDFYWNRLLDPQQAAFSPQLRPAPDWLKLPRFWSGHPSAARRLPGGGYATLHLKVLLDPHSRVLALALPIRTSYEVWINGKPMGKAGTVGPSMQESVPANKPQLVYFTQADETVLDIVIQVSSFYPRLGKIWDGLRLGPAERLSAQRNLRLGVDMLLIGSILMMGCYHLVVFLVRYREKSSLYFGAFCLMAGIGLVFGGEGIVFQQFPGFSWELGMRVEYLCFYAGLPAAAMFLRALYPEEAGRLFVRSVQGAGGLFTLAALLLPVRIFAFTGPIVESIAVGVGLYAAAALTKAVCCKRDGAVFAWAGMAVFAVTVLADIADYNPWIRMGNISSFGLFVLIFMISLVINIRSFKTFASVESLSHQLRELNLGLERRIGERTTELERTNRMLAHMNGELARMEISRRRLLSNISHDLGTPITMIQGYTEALIDQVVSEPEQQQKYLRLILSRINGLNRLIADLFQLSKLEARQIHFTLSEMTAREFIEFFSDRYELEVKKAGIRFSLKVDPTLAPGPEEARIAVDIDRIDQVLTNIVYNAMKHTPKDGEIQLRFANDAEFLTVKVQDSGSGIDPDDLPYIFDRFYKTDPSRNSAAGGSGLGLAIAKEIVEFHGGRIWAESAVGQGASLCFQLPLKPSV